ncbi:MAG: hypothetical protein ACRESJ_14585 [Pseudomonas sp.]|uniref:hypothetical protein n=1 Tax=Pseudomonas sp. TaxID=306 RepID=UPI003D6DB6D1
MSRNFYRGYSPSPGMHPYNHVPPFNALRFTIDFTNCATRQGTQGDIYVRLENHLIGTHHTSVDGGWTGFIITEAQAFLYTIAPGAVLTFVSNDGYVQ